MSEEQKKVAGLVEKYREWKLRHPDFPLTVNPNGQWSKKVRGKVYYFGLLSDPDGAISLWLREKDYLLAGQEPPMLNGGITVEELCDEHIKDIAGRVAAGKLSPASLKEYRAAGKSLREAGVSYMPICSLSPLHFSTVLQYLEDSGRRLRTQKNVIMAIKATFNWGKKMGLYDDAINFGPRFVAPSITEIEAEQEEAGAVRFFERALILDALKIADAKMKVAILMGINCAFYPGDTESITYRHMHLDSPVPYHDFRRVKTRRRRMAALWPETIAAIEEYTACYRPHSESNNILLAQNGKPYTRVSSGKSLSRMFDALIEKVGNRPKGASLGSLRHTYGTLMDFVTDTQMVDLTMGHTSGTIHGQARKSLQRRIYSQMNLKELERLKAVADVVHDWLFDGEIP